MERDGPLGSASRGSAEAEREAASFDDDDEVASEKCGHMDGKVLMPRAQNIPTLTSARLAADVLGVPTVLVARADWLGATLVTSGVDPRDRPFLTGECTSEGYFCTRADLDAAITRALAYAPYADMSSWCETSTPDREEARRFAEAVLDQYPGRLSACNYSPSFNWRRHLDDDTIAGFRKELGAMGYPVPSSSPWPVSTHSTPPCSSWPRYEVAEMSGQVELQEREFALEAEGCNATRHQREVGADYFDEVATVFSGGRLPPPPWQGSTEAAQFDHGSMAGTASA